MPLLRRFLCLPPFLPWNICLVNAAAARPMSWCLLTVQCHQHVCACRTQSTLPCQPWAFGRLLVSNNLVSLHCRRLQRELAQTKDALSKSQASLDERNEQMLRLHMQRTAAQNE